MMMVALPLVETEFVSICPVCGCEGPWVQIAAGFDYEYETCINEWRMSRCSNCGHAWLNPRPTEKELSIIYPPNYYSYDYEKRISPLAVRGKAWLDARKFRSLLAFIGRPMQSYLDVGCSTGRFLRLAQQFGLSPQKAAGIELNHPLVEKLKGEGLTVECSRVEDSALVKEGSFDLITMFHVIEHLSDPKDVVRKLGQSLSHGGILAIETPNSLSLDAKLFRRGLWGGYHFPRHWHIFTPDSLSQLLHDAGLEVIAVRYQPGHSFWLFSFHHALKYRLKPIAWLARAVHPLRSLPALIAMTGFDLLRSWLGFRTSAMLVVAKKVKS